MVSFIALIRGGSKIITTTNWQELHSAVQEFLTVKQLACLAQWRIQEFTLFYAILISYKNLQD